MIFISYRHSDAAYARALQLALERQLGAEYVMRDVKTSGGGGDLRDVLTQQVRDATAVLVLIGPDWMNDRSDDRGGASAQDRDWVRYELSLALAWRRAVVPVLLDGVEMPLRSTLPGDVGAITDLLALRLRDTDWDADIGRLLQHLGYENSPAERPPQGVVIEDAGPVAGGDITITGRNVAGRDGHF